MIAFVLVVLISLLAGGTLGLTAGFCKAAQRDILQGFQPRTRNPILLLLSRPTRDMTSLQTVLFGLLMLIWLPVFVGLSVAPALATLRLSGGHPALLLLAYALAAAAWWIADGVGAQAWNRLM